MLWAQAGISNSEALEIKTVRAMLGIFCRAHHHPDQELCPACSEIYKYAVDRILSCPVRATKPPCEMCKIHCYKPDLRNSVKSVMRYSGPRMIYRHPLLAARHLIAKYRFIKLDSKACQSE
ncbi:MAG: nitrous oxide-stimulated promoter family protein [FCB group bacterium]|nr:nitrous oxide-stimulated promoter family protein [FCB group bacterium]